MRPDAIKVLSDLTLLLSAILCAGLVVYMVIPQLERPSRLVLVGVGLSAQLWLAVSLVLSALLGFAP